MEMEDKRQAASKRILYIQPEEGPSAKKKSLKKFNAVCLDDFKMQAARNIRRDLLGYYETGATRGITLVDNEAAWSRYRLMPRVLRDVSQRSQACEIQGLRVAHPFGLAPTALHCIAHPDGELETARDFHKGGFDAAAGRSGTLMVLSTLSSVPLEDVAAVYHQEWGSAEPSGLWFQLYVFRDRGLTEELVQRAEKSGCTALVVTVDTPISGIRYDNLRERLWMPDNVKFANLTEYLNSNAAPKDNFFADVASFFDPSLTWVSLLEFLGQRTSLPIILKGILSPSDALMAADHQGVAGIIISNHGARQLDSVPASVDCITTVTTALNLRGSRLPVYMDGGVRSGNDIIKALLLGAEFVFIGRPQLWSIASGGHQTLLQMVDILRKEIDVDMALLGASSLSQLTSDMIMGTLHGH